MQPTIDSSVVLPDPEGPSTAQISPAAKLSENALEHGLGQRTLTVGFADAVALEHRSHGYV